MKVMLGVMVALMFVALPAMAIGTAAPASDSFTIFDQAGAIVDQVIVYENVDEDPYQIYVLNTEFINDIVVYDFSQYGNATTLVEPDQTYSDIFGIASGQNNQTGYALAFSSDTEDIPSPYGNSGAIFLEEGNGVFDATMYLNPELQRLGYTATFRSDSEIPEPAALSMIGIGIVALRGLRKTRRTA